MKDYDKYQIEDALSTIFNGWNERMLKELLEAAYFECKSLQSRLEQAEKDAARYALSKKHYYIRISGCKGKYRADNGARVLTDWMDSYDECFDTAMQSAKESQ